MCPGGFHPGLLRRPPERVLDDVARSLGIVLIEIRKMLMNQPSSVCPATGSGEFGSASVHVCHVSLRW